MYYAPGSGVWYDLGRTAIARDLYDLAAKHNVSVTSRYCRKGAPGVRPPCANRREHMHHGTLLVSATARALASRGFDSFQLTHTEEHGLYKYEIVDLRQLRAGGAAKGGRVRALPPTPCPRSSPSLGEPLLRFSHGWGGKLPCRKCTPWRIPGCLSCGRPVGMDSVL